MMADYELDKVLANWIEQANSPLGKRSPDIAPSQWVAEQFTAWWKEQASETLEAAESASQSLREELMSRDGWEALDDVTQLQDALSDLRSLLRLE